MSGDRGELALVEALAGRLPPAPSGETWIGDDAAVVVAPPGALLLATDAMVEGVHADLALTAVDDLGWKALAACVSDIAAMGGVPHHALVAVAVAPGRSDDVAVLYDGIEAAATAWACPVVGGDLTSGPVLMVTVTCTGTVHAGEPGPVLRSGARSDDALLVTGPLGAAAAGLRLLAEAAPGPAPALVDAHRRPVPRLAEGTAARRAGASAMIDLSDGLGLDLRRLAAASDVGVELDHVPVAAGASVDEALGGGDDYELLLAAPDPDRVVQAFARAGLRPPVVIGHCTDDPAELRLDGGALPPVGWEHRW